MADNTTVNLDSGSPARVAWDMVKFLRAGVPGESTAQKIEGYLDLYARCYQATSGKRAPKE